MADDAPKVGRLITDGERRRDAIHVAVAPVTAGEPLHPGDHVGLVGPAGDLETVGRTADPIGVIDPFLPGPVGKGERCWLFLYPNTVTSLRHVWTHPTFQARHREAVRALEGGV
jgi:hypothetical protein